MLKQLVASGLVITGMVENAECGIRDTGSVKNAGSVENAGSTEENAVSTM